MNHYLTAMEAMSSIFNVDAKPLDVFNKKTYHANFESFYGGLLPAFDAIEELYTTVGEPQEMLANMADAMVGQAVDAVESAGRKSAKDSMMMNLNMQLATFIYPAILHYKGESSRPLADTIGVKYKKAFPKSNVQAAEVEYIEKGFHRKFCYITTAVCESFGKPDHCYELERFREYRDRYLRTCPDGEAMIRGYYDVAPSIVKHINALPESKQIYLGIWEAYLQPCLQMIEEGKDEACREKYLEMVQEMKQRYFLM